MAAEADKGRPLLEVEGVRKRFGGIQAVDGASFPVPAGSVTALIGPNGAGKTTLFDLVTGFAPADSGSVRFDGEEMAHLAAHRIARRGMVRTFQLTRALAAMPVIDNMLLAAPDQPGEHLRNVVMRPRAVRAREREVTEQAMELLEVFGLRAPLGLGAILAVPLMVAERVIGVLNEVFGLRDHADAYAGTLSGGQRKLLELARALMARPRLLLLDEPMAGINPTLGRRLLDHIQRLRSEEGVTFLYVEHDMEVVMNHSDRVVVMAEGRVIAAGEPHEVRSDAAVVDAYLGSPA